MALDINYQDFFLSSFLIECRERGLKTSDFLSFANSLMGVDNFIRNHPIPFLEYYWECDMGKNKLIESVAEKLGVNLKKIKIVCSEKEVDNAEENICYVLPCPLRFNDSHCYGGIEAVKRSITNAAIIVDLKSNDIIQNEELWEKCELIDSYTHRHSSDEFEYCHIFKTGWAYLAENPNITLDSLLISYLKNKVIDLKREQYEEYAGFRFGVHPIPKESINGLMAFRTHPIDRNIVSIILNDPIQWEGIFYDQNFCNNSILKYVKALVPNLKEQYFDL